jgi:hypothetical protein
MWESISHPERLCSYITSPTQASTSTSSETSRRLPLPAAAYAQISTPVDNMSSCPNEDCLLTIRQLMAEKDRLIMEKDEIVDSKDRLWREMHQMLQDKNERIEELLAKCTAVGELTNDGAENQALREEVHRLQHRHRELEKALREALETDEENSDDDMETDSPSALAGNSFDQVIKYGMCYTYVCKCAANHFVARSENPSTGPYSAHRSEITATGNRQLHTPASQDAVTDNEEYILAQFRPPTSVKILPVIESSSYTQHTYATLSLLAPGLLNSILDLLKVLGNEDKFSTFSREGRNGCFERQLRSKNGTSWSLTQPGCFVCKTCFNNKRPCMRAVGRHQWLLLPLPPDVRDPGATWQDEAYYIHQGTESNLSFSGVWEASRSAVSRRATREATARQASGLTE